MGALRGSSLKTMGQVLQWPGPWSRSQGTVPAGTLPASGTWGICLLPQGRRWAEGVLLHSGPLFDLTDKLMTLTLLLNGQIVTNEVRVTVRCFCSQFGEPCQVVLAFVWGPQEDPSQCKVSGPLP